MPQSRHLMVAFFIGFLLIQSGCSSNLYECDDVHILKIERDGKGKCIIQFTTSAETMYFCSEVKIGEGNNPNVKFLRSNIEKRGASQSSFELDEKGLQYFTIKGIRMDKKINVQEFQSKQ